MDLKYVMQALTEPDYGSDASSLATTASKVFLFMPQLFRMNSNFLLYPPGACEVFVFWSHCGKCIIPWNLLNEFSVKLP